MKDNKKKKYEGFSLVEMLVTLAIISMVMIVSATVLTTLVKVSTVANDKIQARNESEFVLELVRRTVRNSNPQDVYIFKSDTVRHYNPETGIVEPIENKNVALAYEEGLGEGESGNEIQFRPYGYRDWICLAYFKSSEDDERGYILKTSAQDLGGNHESCFYMDPADPSSYLMILNSDHINVKDLTISYVELVDGNYMITFDIRSEPVNWYLSGNSPLRPEVFRQGVVSTEGIVW